MLNDGSLVMPFSRINIRVAAAVFAGTAVAVLRTDRAGGSHYSLPGGNLEPGEDPYDGLARELAEELDLDLARATVPELLWVQDQRITRPGATPSPRKLHFVYRCLIPPHHTAELATEEHDTAPDGGVQVSHVEWIDYRTTADLPLYPAAGRALAALAHPEARPEQVDLPPMTDETYTWM